MGGSASVADSNQAVLDQSDVVRLCVRPQDAPAEIAVRAIPLPAVATRTGLAAIHPPHETARATFDPLGGVIALDEERALDALGSHRHGAGVLDVVDAHSTASLSASSASGPVRALASRAGCVCCSSSRPCA